MFPGIPIVIFLCTTSDAIHYFNLKFLNNTKTEKNAGFVHIDTFFRRKHKFVRRANYILRN